MSDWYYALDNEQKGPINEAELKENLATNKLPLDIMVWKEGMENWTPANQVPALSFRQPPIPAKVQPSTAVATPEEPAPPHDSTSPINLSALVGKGETLEVDYEDAEKNKVFGILAYINILWLVPLMMAKDSPFAKYHANQGLVLFITWVGVVIVVNVLDAVLRMVLPLGLYTILSLLGFLYLGILILAVIGIINAAQGKCVPLPLVGSVKLLK